eukprot:SAG11_NODE_13311_length_660_cov_2.221034_2_plen_71_part_01
MHMNPNCRRLQQLHQHLGPPGSAPLVDARPAGVSLKPVATASALEGAAVINLPILGGRGTPGAGLRTSLPA